MERYTFIKNKSPLIATAIHDGHLIRPELLTNFKLTDQERRREEDPYTAELTKITDNRIVVNYSRFETDLNRPREKAVYQQPEDAWGLDIWRENLDHSTVDKSLHYYDDFYDTLEQYIESLLRDHEHVVLYDIHTYNHRREGIDVYADPVGNPEVNIGTGNIDKDKWAEVVDTFIKSARSYNYEGRYLDVRENVKFEGGYFSKWLHDHYAERVCAIAIEFKKFFMNEWTNEVDPVQLVHLKEMLTSTINPVVEATKKLNLKVSI